MKIIKMIPKYHLTQTEKNQIRAFLDSGQENGKINTKLYSIVNKEYGEITIKISTKRPTEYKGQQTSYDTQTVKVIIEEEYKLYDTIREAFKNGTGDVFFEKSGKYIAVSRKEPGLIDKLTSIGFNFLEYSSVISIDAIQFPKKEEVLPNNVKETVQEEKRILRLKFNYRSTMDFYYEEMPDGFTSL